MSLGSSSFQAINPEMLDLLAQHFRKLEDAALCFSQAVGMVQMFPGLRAYWPGSAVGGGITETTQLVDMSGNGFHMTRVAPAALGCEGLIPYVDFDGFSARYARADEAAFDITGTEGYIMSDFRGLTIGAWVRFNEVANATYDTIAGKWVSPNLSYILARASNGTIRFGISSDGSNVIAKTGTAVPAVWDWTFVCGRYSVADSALKVWTNDSTTERTDSVPSSIYSGSADFNMGARATPSNFLNGQISQLFLCAAAVPDQFIETFFNFTAPMFGV